MSTGKNCWAPLTSLNPLCIGPLSLQGPIKCKQQAIDGSFIIRPQTLRTSSTPGPSGVSDSLIWFKTTLSSNMHNMSTKQNSIKNVFKTRHRDPLQHRPLKLSWEYQNPPFSMLYYNGFKDQPWLSFIQNPIFLLQSWSLILSSFIFRLNTQLFL